MAETMTKAAFGQILYWLLQDKTLRGQSQIRFTEIDVRLKKYEPLVRNLLSQEPSKRLQSKDEITEFLKSNDRVSQEHQFRRKKEQSLHAFDNIIYKYASHLGMSGSGFIRFDDTESIDEIMEDLCKEQESLNLWFSQGYSDCSLDSIKKLDDEKCWLLEGREVKFNSIWVYKHFASFGGSFLIIETDYLNPSGLYKNPGSVEEVGLFDNKTFVTRQEYDTGWAVINGKRTEVLVSYLLYSCFFGKRIMQMAHKPLTIRGL